MVTSVYFIRHAEPNYENHDDFSRELTPKGLQDSQNLVNLFTTIPINLFFSRPYKRSIDTISPLAHFFEKEIVQIDDLRERKITDSWIEDFTGFTEKQWLDFSYHLPGGESLQQVQERNIKTLEKILQVYRQQTIVIGTHGTALSTILNFYSPNFGLADFNKIKRIFPYIIRLGFDNLTLLSINEIPL
ncbi:histidine phosphatase family protein [Streptococcus sp. X16XC17]|uniref:histidine phosphatase family protein n=1 Tax=unclassified Streptococcus TaxID=2608887 RepID=UPI00066FD37E|nr:MULTISPECIES: histidine phosphatase family protein [unclassified Streptococcus]TCD45462.1 histidine phosphatase family protein [Streptococcus sp. X16XC17]